MGAREEGRVREGERVMLGLEFEIINLIEPYISSHWHTVLMAFLRFFHTLVASKSSVTLSGVEVPCASKVKFWQKNGQTYIMPGFDSAQPDKFFSLTQPSRLNSLSY